MADLTYKMTEPPPRPFRAGDKVEVLDREHVVLDTRTITNVFKTGVVKTDCGRSWTKDGLWIGSERPWPFPSIRLVSN